MVPAKVHKRKKLNERPAPNKIIRCDYENKFINSSIKCYSMTVTLAFKCNKCNICHFTVLSLSFRTSSCYC